MKWHEPKASNVGKYIVVGAVALYLLSALASGPTGFVAQIQNITSTNPIVTVIIGLVLVFFFLGVINHFYPVL
jgi:membrane protein YdbS with pleckstrin-like domain